MPSEKESRKKVSFMEKHHPKEQKHHAHAGSESPAHHHKKDATMQKIIIGLALIFLIITVYDVYLIYSSSAAVNEKIAASTEAAKPANLEVTKILAQSCADCFDAAQIENAIKQLNVKISEKSLDYTSAEAKQIISRYNITKIPTMLITGEVGKADIGFWNQIGTTENDGTLVLRFGAPYIDASSGTEFGRVQLIELSDKTCSSCYNVSIQENILKQGFGISLSKITGYDISSSDGAMLVSKYNITKVPTIILSPDAKYYEINNFQNTWKQVGTIEKDGWYVFREMNALQGVNFYKDLSLNKILNTTG